MYSTRRFVKRYSKYKWHRGKRGELVGMATETHWKSEQEGRVTSLRVLSRAIQKPSLDFSSKFFPGEITQFSKMFGHIPQHRTSGLGFHVLYLVPWTVLV